MNDEKGFAKGDQALLNETFYLCFSYQTMLNLMNGFLEIDGRRLFCKQLA